MDQKHVEGDELLRGVANRMNKLSGRGEVATKHQREDARVLNPRSSIDQHARNNDSVQPRVFENLIAYGEPRVSESSKQNGLSKSDSMVNPTSIGESWTVNPSKECVIKVEEGACLVEGDGISVSRMAGNFVLKDPKLDVNNIDATTEAVANERSYTSLGESTIRSTMNPSCGSKSDVKEGIWSTKDPPHLLMSIVRPTGWNLTNNNNVPTKHDDDAPITQSVDINSTPNSYAGAAGTNKVIQPKEQANFRPMVSEKVFDGVNISIPHKVLEKAKHGLKRIMMNAKGFFFFKFDSRAGLDAVLEGGSWMIRNSPIILKKWSVNTSLQKEEMTVIPIMVSFGKLLCFSIQVFKEDGISLIALYLVIYLLDSYTITKCNGVLGRKSHVDVAVVYDTCKKVCSRWKWTSNRSLCDKGSRIILGWNDDLVDVMIMAQTNQVMHVQVNTRIDNKTLFCSFIYADNYYIDHRALWNNLVGHAGLMRNRSWVLLGDFNAALNIEDHSSGGYEPNVAMRDFKECVQAMEVADVNSTGLHFTWNQKPKGSNGILKKIDRIMGNLKFNDDFPGSFAIFQPYRISDHSPCVLRIPMVTKPKPKPFKFSNFLVYKEGFREIVDSGWNVHIEGYAMYRVVKRLKGLKSPFRKLLHNHGNLHDRVNKIRIELDEAQKAIDRDPSSSVLREEHAHYLLAFKEALLDEERFLQQKAKVEWLKAGDSNTSYFHKIVKSKCARNRIEIVSDSSNNFYDGNQVPGAFVKHYNQFLGAEGVSNPLDAHDLFIRVLDNSKADCMVRDVTDDEIKSVMFSMGDDRAPGPDGFTAAFFKKAWDVVGGDITCAIRDFFLQWPISCCNVLYKCISKIIANRVKEGLGDIVSINQSAFVPGRRISDNILLTQELMRNYHRRRGPPRCAFKVDIQKAYDTVDWKFLETILVGFGFHPKMVQWIMVCVSGASYSISVNGNVHGWFKGKRGLRQGDPLSPYLFTLVMEILTLLLQRKVRNSDEFQYHHLCEQQRIINLCFADDLFLFARGHPSSVSVIMDALEEFKQVSGLVPSIPKSTAYFCNVPNAIKASILNSMPFAEGVLPVRYLGVPLISSRLLFRDCKILVEKLESRVNDWRNKFLSLAGRLQLIRSVLSSMHIYWASVFILPSRIVHDLEQLMRGFLWCQGEMKKGKAKVAWDSVCMPKHEGGLGIRRIEDFNIALMATHIWSIFTHRESLWVKWVHTYKLKGRSFWDVPCRGDASWGWRKLLQIRSTIRPFIWHKINNGKSTSVWFDRWTDVCPLKDLLSNRDIVRSGFSLENSVSNLISDGVWRWPLDWLSRFPFLAQLHVPVLLDDMDDVILWRDRDGVLRPFSVACVWDTIRSRADMVYWYNVVWFSHCIPRHAIHMWLVIQQKLKTQDRLRQWDVGPSIDLNLLKCPLCDLVPDSHDHLFFECSFSSQVWSKVRVLCGMDAIPPHLSDVVAFIVPLSKGKTVVSIISRIVVAATSYYIWLERNGRLFKKKTSTPGQIVDVIFSTVRLKLVTFKFKKMSTKSRLLLDQWKIPSYCIVHDGSTRQPYLDLYCSYRVAAGLRDARLIICSHLGLCLLEVNVPPMIFLPHTTEKELQEVLVVPKHGIAVSESAGKTTRPLIRLIDILESYNAFLFRVVLPVVKKNETEAELVNLLLNKCRLLKTPGALQNATKIDRKQELDATQTEADKASKNQARKAFGASKASLLIHLLAATSLMRHAGFERFLDCLSRYLSNILKRNYVADDAKFQISSRDEATPLIETAFQRRLTEEQLLHERDQLAIAKESGRRLGIGTNMYPSSSFLFLGKGDYPGSKHKGRSGQMHEPSPSEHIKGNFMDKRDSEIKEKLSNVKDTSTEVKQLEEQAAAVTRAARAEISAALNQMKKETAAEVDAKLAERRKKVEVELQEALLNLEKQEDTIKSLDSRIAALSQEIVNKVLPVQ
ncbi:putative RNA-directed DNA polymerase [Tanacetum coccineum]